MRQCGTMMLIVMFGLLAPASAQVATTTKATTRFAAQVIEQSSAPTVGTEGRLEVVLPWNDVLPKEADSKADVVVRVADKRVWGTGWRYDLRWVAATPGKHDLIRALRRESADDTPEGQLPLEPILLQAVSVLPEAHDGTLTGLGNDKLGGLRWYWPVAAIVGLAWMALLIPGFVRRMRSTKVVRVVTENPPLTLAERLRPLVEAAARGDLDAEGQGQLERLLLQIWRQRLGLEGVRPSEAILRMKDDLHAGELLRALESWLHLPPGRNQTEESEINRLLRPYTQMPEKEVRGA